MDNKSSLHAEKVIYISESNLYKKRHSEEKN